MFALFPIICPNVFPKVDPILENKNAIVAMRIVAKIICS